MLALGRVGLIPVLGAMGKSLKSGSKTPEVPAWIGAYFAQAYDSHKRLTRVVSVSRRGIASLTELPRLTKALARVKGEEPDAEFTRSVEEDAALAKSEIENNFPVLHSLATVGLWSWLEHLVKGLVTEWIVHNRSALRSTALQRIRVRISDYALLTKREQAAYLVELLEQETAASLKRGVNRFETLLEPLGLTGNVSEEITKALFELQQVRNAIAHQNGRCDRRLRSSCPWLKLKIGDPISIGPDQLRLYSTSTVEYALAILYRLGDHHGKNLRPQSDDT
jgi:hypothetical protein